MGKKRVRRRLLLLAAALLCAACPARVCKAKEAAGEVRLEGVSSCMPDMWLYCYPDQPERISGAGVSYGGEALAASEPAPYAQTGQGSDYYMLLDISGSVSEAYFAQMKACIQEFHGKMAPQDTMTLLTFGDAVQTVFQNKRAEEDISAELAPLANHDQTTRLFAAMLQTAELADTKERAGIRKIAIVFTDGEDFSEHTATKDEALAALQEKRIPLYAMAAKETYRGENAYLDGMGEFVRSCGGTMKAFDTETAVSSMQEFQSLFQSAYVIHARAETNLVDYQAKPLVLTYAGGKTLTADYNASWYQADDAPPTAKLEKTGKSELCITFSEAVSGADSASAYEITLKDAALTDGYMAHYDKEAHAVSLTFEEALANGAYEIRFRGIKDVSMEEHPLKAVCRLEITDGREKGILDYLMEYQAFVAGGAAFLLFLLALLLAWKAVKKRRGIVMVEGKAVLEANVRKTRHVAVQKKEIPARPIRFLLEGAQGGREIEMMVERSLIVGRSDICDLSIDDEKMSRQHFAIHDRDGAFYIEDLHTTNGTRVNGRNIQTPVRLSVGDRISVGELTMTVRW